MSREIDIWSATLIAVLFLAYVGALLYVLTKPAIPLPSSLASAWTATTGGEWTHPAIVTHERRH